jgi:predicted RNA-binding protein Jag
MGARASRQITVRSNTYGQIYEALRDTFGVKGTTTKEQLALEEAAAAVDRAIAEGHPVELMPQNAYIRRLQHELVTRHDQLYSESVGHAPARRVRVVPK